jgi:hypothetical protein
MKVITRLSPLLLGLSSQILASAPMGKDQQTTETAPVVIEGVILPRAKEQFGQIVGNVKTVRQSQLLPLNFGGTTFMGLVGRLLGEAPNRHHEGIQTRRNIYFAEGELKSSAESESKNVLALAHGSKFDHGRSGSPEEVFDVVVFYTPGGTVLKVDVTPLPPSLAEEFKKDNILGQFEGHTTESFEVIRGRRGRLVSKGHFLTKARKPKSAEGRVLFEKILRSIRFNAAFMDVAYFITQHPDRADISIQEFPDQIEVTKGMPSTGPEAFVKDKNLSSPIDGKGNQDQLSAGGED